MNPNAPHTISLLHDKIAETEKGFQSALDENKDYHLIKKLKVTVDTLKKQLKQMETTFHEEFKNRQL